MDLDHLERLMLGMSLLGVIAPMADRLIRPFWHFFVRPRSTRLFIGSGGDRVEIGLSWDASRMVKDIAQALELRSRSASSNGPTT